MLWMSKLETCLRWNVPRDLINVCHSRDCSTFSHPIESLTYGRIVWDAVPSLLVHNEHDALSTYFWRFRKRRKISNIYSTDDGVIDGISWTSSFCCLPWYEWLVWCERYAIIIIMWWQMAMRKFKIRSSLVTILRSTKIAHSCCCCCSISLSRCAARWRRGHSDGHSTKIMHIISATHLNICSSASAGRPSTLMPWAMDNGFGHRASECMSLHNAFKYLCEIYIVYANCYLLTYKCAHHNDRHRIRRHDATQPSRTEGFHLKIVPRYTSVH